MTATAASSHGDGVDVFVSYSHDDRTFASDLARHLEAAGVTVFIDKQGLRGSPGWRKPVAEAIAACKVVVLLCSKSAWASPFVENEVEFHIDLDPPPPRVFVPIHLETSTTYPPTIHFCLVGRHKRRIEVSGRPIAEWLAEILEELEEHEVDCDTSYSPKPLAPVAPAPAVRRMPTRVERRLEMGTTFRMFVSSTFADFERERDVLHRRVFPELQELCLSRGARFLAIDPNWGVTEESSRDPRAMGIRFREIDRCWETTDGPSFIALLGDMYGWRPPPAQIPLAEFKLIRERVSAEDARLLDESYLQDDNAVPPDYYLKARNGAAWTSIEHALQETLARVVAGTELEGARRYAASAAEQEIGHGVLDRIHPDRHAFCFLRRIYRLPEDASAGPYRDLRPDGEPDAEARMRVEALRERLRELIPDNVHGYVTPWEREGPSTLHLQQFRAEVTEILSRAILDRIEAVG